MGMVKYQQELQRANEAASISEALHLKTKRLAKQLHEVRKALRIARTPKVVEAPVEKRQLIVTKMNTDAATIGCDSPSIILCSQEHVNTLGSHGCSHLRKVSIDSCQNGRKSNIVSLHALRNLSTVDELVIGSNENLTSLSGLDS